VLRVMPNIPMSVGVESSVNSADNYAKNSDVSALRELLFSQEPG
jgi:pyrroline-5-carboxylate reductase